MQPDVTSGQAYPFPMHMCQAHQYLSPSPAPEESNLQEISSQCGALLLTGIGVNSLLSHSKSLWSSVFRDFMMPVLKDRQEDVAAKLHKIIHTSALLKVPAVWPKSENTSALFNMKMPYALHYQGSSFFSYLYVCVHISLVLSHSCFSLHLTSVYTADFLSHLYKLPEVKWPGSLSSSESCLSHVFPPFLQQSWASTLPSACQCVWSRGVMVCTTTTHRADICSHCLMTILLGRL